MKQLLMMGSAHGSKALQSMWMPFAPSDAQWSERYDSTICYRNRKIVFLVDLDELGFCQCIHGQLLALWQRHGDSAMQDSEGMIVLSSPSDLYSKRAAQNIAFWANRMGCRFMGHSLVESLYDLSNFKTWQKTVHLSLEEIRADQCGRLFERFFHYRQPVAHNPKILALHASSQETSNTLMLWRGIERFLSDLLVDTLHIENGSVVDCKGCDFVTCSHFARQKSCFYGGTVTRDVLPTIERADIVVIISPNYNDALSAMHTALINRLTALYRRFPLYEKRFYGVIVSGNSGSDSVACQMLGALNFNKGMDMPPGFSIMRTANDPGSILKDKDFDCYTKAFAERIIREAKGEL